MMEKQKEIVLFPRPFSAGGDTERNTTNSSDYSGATIFYHEGFAGYFMAREQSTRDR